MLALDPFFPLFPSFFPLFDASVIPKKPSLRRNQQWALDEIETKLINSTVFGKDGAPSLRKCIDFDEAVLFVSERMPTDAKHRKLRAKEAIAALVEKRYLA